MLILEKAFAKLCGSYAALEGGLTLWALHVMTGDVVFSLSRKDGSAWKRLDMRPQPTDDNPRKVGLYHTKEEYTAEQLWQLLRAYDSSAALLAASISSQAGEAKRDDGLVAGHAYSIIRVAEMHGFRLVQLRNPWGRYEWGGEWSDESPLWDEHPAVQRALWPLRSSTPRNRMNDGSFWMPFAKFCEIYSTSACAVRNAPPAAAQGVGGGRVGTGRSHALRGSCPCPAAAHGPWTMRLPRVPDRSTGLHDLSLRFDEDGACAPCLGASVAARAFGAPAAAAPRHTVVTNRAPERASCRIRVAAAAAEGDHARHEHASELCGSGRALSICTAFPLARVHM